MALCDDDGWPFGQIRDRAAMAVSCVAMLHRVTMKEGAILRNPGANRNLAAYDCCMDREHHCT